MNSPGVFSIRNFDRYPVRSRQLPQERYYAALRPFVSVNRGFQGFKKLAWAGCPEGDCRVIYGYIGFRV